MGLEEYTHSMITALRTDTRLYNGVRAGTLDAGRVVSLWANLVGPEKVTVVVLDRQARTMEHTFEDLLNLPVGFIVDRMTKDAPINRSVTLDEANLLAALSDQLTSRLAWRERFLTVRRGAARGIISAFPNPQGERLTIPSSADHDVAELAKAHAQQIADSGVRVVGDLSRLAALPTRPTGTPASSASPSSFLRQDLATAAMVGLAVYAAQQMRDASEARAETKKVAAAPPDLSRASASSLIRHLMMRLRRRLTGGRPAARPSQSPPL